MLMPAGVESVFIGAKCRVTLKIDEHNPWLKPWYDEILHKLTRLFNEREKVLDCVFLGHHRAMLFTRRVFGDLKTICDIALKWAVDAIGVNEDTTWEVTRELLGNQLSFNLSLVNVGVFGPRHVNQNYFNLLTSFANFGNSNSNN